ncbi:MAG: hypothetical protein WD003_01830 [Candidatus Paceibacterota bacterium]
MFDFITRLQKKPLHVRKSIAFFVTIALMVPVLALWFFSLPLAGGVSNIAGSGAALSPFSVIGKEFSTLYQNTRDELENIPTLEYVPPTQ